MARKEMTPEVAERLAAWAKEKAILKTLGEFPGKRKGGYSDFIQRRELEFDMSGRPDYDWENDVEVTDDSYITDESPYTSYQQDETSYFDVGDLFDEITVNPTKEYLQGPESSSRVSSFRFEPTETATEENVTGETLSGYIVVSFIKRAYNKSSNVVQYGPLKLSDFTAFKKEFSLGTAVVGLESYGFTYV